jgi:hypothetical protein
MMSGRYVSDIKNYFPTKTNILLLFRINPAEIAEVDNFLSTKSNNENVATLSDSLKKSVSGKHFLDIVSQTITLFLLAMKL